MILDKEAMFKSFVHRIFFLFLFYSLNKGICLCVLFKATLRFMGRKNEVSDRKFS